MAMLITSANIDITATRAVSELDSRLRKKIFEQLATLRNDEQILLLQNFKNGIAGELASEKAQLHTFAGLYDELDQAVLPAQLAITASKFKTSVVQHFQQRHSVSAFHSCCTRFRDTLLKKTLAFAEADLLLQTLQRPPVRFTVMADGYHGREEQSLSGGSNFYMIYDGSGKQCDEYFKQLIPKIILTLNSCGISLKLDKSHTEDQFWSGSVFAWQGFIEKQLQPATSSNWLSSQIIPALSATTSSIPSAELDYTAMIETLADLRYIYGDMKFSDTLIAYARARVHKEQNSTTYRQISKRIAAMPVARNMFGWFRVLRSGEHKGEFSLEHLALGPLIRTVRFMVLKRNIWETGSCNRIKALCSNRGLGIELSERLLLAYQEFALHKIMLEIRRELHVTDIYFNPEELAEGEKEQFKNGLDAVVSLQKLLYQELTEAA